VPDSVREWYTEGEAVSEPLPGRGQRAGARTRDTEHAERATVVGSG
jgi:hypothetical protein